MGNNQQKSLKEVIKGNKNYKVIKKLGGGGFGSVQLILINNKSYALKILKNLDKNDIPYFLELFSHKKFKNSQKSVIVIAKRVNSSDD